MSTKSSLQFVSSIKESDNLKFFAELIKRLRKVYASFFLLTIFITLMPKSFLDGNITFQNYTPAIYAIISRIVDHSVAEMTKSGKVQIMITSPLTVFTISIEVAIILSLLVNVPLFFYQLYRFVEPGLYSNEKRMLRNGMLLVGALFFIGGILAYFFILPVTLTILTTLSNPLLNYGTTKMVLFFSLNSIMNIIIWTVLSSAILYTLPALIYLLVLLDIIDVNYLVRNRKNIILAVLIFAAVITPDPTPFSMLILSIPLLVVYELMIQHAYQNKVSKRRINIGGILNGI